ncbi:PPE domain-containing protein [Nocardia colli]|uniref:PPE domain-containing protein n=1 Tax=Nocardia colli TaxID=2545717 RepID=UPI0035DDA0D0
MDLEVDPADIIGQAARTHALLGDANAAAPTGWVQAPGRDSLSSGKAKQRNAETAGLINEASWLIRQLQETAHKVGASGAGYTEADDSAGRLLGGGAAILTNPVPEPDAMNLRHPPSSPEPAGSASVDSLTFARQLHDGPGIGPASEFADRIRGFADTLTETAGRVGETAGAMQSWRPVGSAAAAEFTRFQDRLDRVGARLRGLAGDIDDDLRSFRAVVAKHPRPEDISAARSDLLTAMRSRNSIAVARAKAKLDEQNAQSHEAITGYSSALGSDRTAVGSSAAAAKKNTRPSATNTSSSGMDTSAIMAMMPALMSAISAAAPLAQSAVTDHAEQYGTGGYPDYSYDSPAYYPYGGSPSSTGPAPLVTSGTATDATTSTASAVPVFATGQMPVTANPTGQTSAPALPRAPVIEPLSAASSTTSTARPSGMPYMPYMPMMPGAGGPGGGDRHRVVAWHPDRTMFTDDTQHTEQVIGEQPTITPTVTPPTPPRSDAGPAQSGASG